MDELMLKIMKKLDITIDKSPDAYNILKQQNFIYDTCNDILGVLGALGLVTLAFTIIEMEVISRRRETDTLVVLKIFTPMVLIILAAVGVIVYRNTHTSDIMFLRSVFK